MGEREHTARVAGAPGAVNVGAGCIRSGSRSGRRRERRGAAQGGGEGIEEPLGAAAARVSRSPLVRWRRRGVREAPVGGGEPLREAAACVGRPLGARAQASGGPYGG
jgi:hypothetical protein